MTRKTALVLGGSGGIGLAIAHLLAEEGFRLTIQGRRDETVAAALDQLNSDAGEPPLGMSADLADEAQVRQVVAAHEERWGRLDILVNSAGVGIGQNLEEIRAKTFDLQVAINLRAAVLATRDCLPLLEQAGAEHGKALIVHVSSWAGKHPPAWLSVYGASKAALISFAASSQKELAGKGIQVTALCPATVETEMTTYAQGEIPAEEMIRPLDIAEAVRFLLRTSPNCVIPEIVIGRTGDLSG
ncbi:MAG: SDR family oxidoreductase [Actinomycetota bacterium]|nr:SDR family oxidoreductase [Actinomycetota bacterium]